LTASRVSPRGTLADPFSDEDRWRKFEDCCLPVLGAGVTAQLYEELGAFSQRAGVSELMQVIARPAGHLAA